jgi:hypothetical protein
MIVTVYNVKGGSGKTPISVNIVLDKEWAIGTNEPFHVLDEFIPDDRVLSVSMEESFPQIPSDIDIVFDLAGSISTHSHSIITAIKQSDLVIVPINNEVKSHVAGLNTIREILPFTKNILVVATKLQKRKGETFKDWKDSEDCRDISRAVNGAFQNETESGAIPNGIKVLPLKFSTAFDRIFEDELSIEQLRGDNPLLNGAYKDVSAQFNDIYTEIERVRHA